MIQASEKRESNYVGVYKHHNGSQDGGTIL